MSENTLSPQDILMGAEGVQEAEAELNTPEAPEEPAAPEAPEATEKPATETAGKEEPEKAEESTKADDDRKVSLKALQEERAKRKELQERLDAFERAMAEAKKEVDYANDPTGALKAEQEALKQQQAALAEHLQRLQVIDTYRQSAARAGEAFKPAYQHLLQARDAELQAMGIEDPAARAATIQAEEFQLVTYALQQGRDPAELIMSLSKARGFVHKGQEQAEVRKAGLEAAKGVSKAAKSANVVADDAEAILNIDDDDEFNAAFERMLRGK